MTHSAADSTVRDLAFKRVLVIRLSAIGDVVFASPLIDAIARRPGGGLLAGGVRRGAD